MERLTDAPERTGLALSIQQPFAWLIVNGYKPVVRPRNETAHYMIRTRDAAGNAATPVSPRIIAWDAMWAIPGQSLREACEEQCGDGLFGVTDDA